MSRGRWCVGKQRRVSALREGWEPAQADLDGGQAVLVSFVVPTLPVIWCRKLSGSLQFWGVTFRRFWELDATGQLCSLAVASSTVQMLKVSEISINSALVSWDSVAGATGYRVAWGPTPGKILLSSSLPQLYVLL